MERRVKTTHRLKNLKNSYENQPIIPGNIAFTLPRFIALPVSLQHQCHFANFFIKTIAESNLKNKLNNNRLLITYK